MRYITDDDYEIALKNGICKNTLINRVRNLGWDIKSAINTPIVSKEVTFVTKEQLQRAFKNGITKDCLYTRIVVRNWDVEKAITTPVIESTRQRATPVRKVERIIDEAVKGYSQAEFDWILIEIEKVIRAYKKALVTEIK